MVIRAVCSLAGNAQIRGNGGSGSVFVDSLRKYVEIIGDGGSGGVSIHYNA